MHDSSGRNGESIDRSTLVMSVEDFVHRPQLSAREAFSNIYPLLRRTVADGNRRSAVAAAVTQEGQVAAYQVMPSHSTVIVGRHSRCGFRLTSSHISLRHLASFFQHEQGDEAAFHLCDLNTGLPFETESGDFSHAVVAEGPLFIKLGGYVLLFIPLSALPIWPSQSSEAWRDLPARCTEDLRTRAGIRGSSRSWPEAVARGSSGNRQQALSLKTEGSRSRDPEGAVRLVEKEDSSRITLVDAPLLLADAVDADAAWGTLAVEQPGGIRRHHLSLDQLDRGILVGRYPRCEIRLGKDERISRVHLLVVRISGQIWVIDTGSTNGIRRGGKRTLTSVMARRDRIRLASTTILRWQQLVLGEG